MTKIIGQGAEATIILTENDTVLKDRLAKAYRHKQIDDELRKTRTRREAKILKKIEPIGPSLISTDQKEKIEMEYIKGQLMKEILDENIGLSKEIGRITGELHDKDIIHGDLTTSNIILQAADPRMQTAAKVRFIDFGLSTVSTKEEDKAVDLHLFKEAVESKHYKHEEEIWNQFLEGYNPKNKKEILKRLEKVELRGRNKNK